MPVAIKRASADRHRRSDKYQQHADQPITFVDVSEARDDAEHDGHQVARLAFRGFQTARCAAVGDWSGCSLDSVSGVSVYSKDVIRWLIVDSEGVFVKAAVAVCRGQRALMKAVEEFLALQIRAEAAQVAG